MAHCSYCGLAAEAICDHVLAATNADADDGFSVSPFEQDPPVVPEDLADVVWSEQQQRDAFGRLFGALDAYDDGLSEAPRQPALFDCLVSFLDADLEEVEWDQQWMGAAGSLFTFAEDPRQVRADIALLMGELEQGFRKLEGMEGERLPEPEPVPTVVKAPTVHIVARASTHVPIVVEPQPAPGSLPWTWSAEGAFRMAISGALGEHPNVMALRAIAAHYQSYPAERVRRTYRDALKTRRQAHPRWPNAPWWEELR